MKIGIISDSHDNMPKIESAVELFNSEGVELVLHGGDLISPLTADRFARLNAPFIGIFGNNDGERLYLTKKFEDIGKIYPDYHEFSFGERRGVLMHEPKFIDALVASGMYDLIVYGHTHKVDIREGKILVVNPGECCGWMTGRATVAIVDGETLHVRLLDV